MVIFGQTSMQEILVNNVEVGTIFEVGISFGVILHFAFGTNWKLVPTYKSVHTIRLPGQVVPLVVIFGETSKQEVLGKNGPQI